MYVCALRSEEGVDLLELGVTGGCELLCWGWESSLGPQEEQPMLLTGAITPVLLFMIKKYSAYLTAELWLTFKELTLILHKSFQNLKTVFLNSL